MLPVTLALSTLLSEDLACVAAGALIARGVISPAEGVLACAFGIFAGDCALWAIGRFGGVTIRRFRWLSSRVGAPAIDAAARWLDNHAGLLIIGSRFTPGTRLPLYVSAGLTRMSFARFAGWTAAAVAIWTPAIVLASARGGTAGEQAGGGAGWVLLAAMTSVLVLTQSARLLAASKWKTLPATLRRLKRWEFWPPAVFYAPVVAWIAVLAVRYRGLAPITTCNPGIEDGGLVGESKAAILATLPSEHVIPAHKVAAGRDALQTALACMAASSWTFPVVVKPDVGQRGVGVRLVRTAEQLASYLSAAPVRLKADTTSTPGDVLIQLLHEGPYEAGVFYYRFPGEEHGRILSITDKVFPVAIGDGSSTLRQLIERHPRYRLQSALFFKRHEAALDQVLAPGERRPLAFAGNHAQGTTFRDGSHLWTIDLERRIDAIAQRFPGFFIGRFDIRYRSVEAFKAGHDLAIVELNGATAESTNIYDPDWTLLQAYRTLFHQWSLVFAIGAANLERGAVPTPWRRLVSLVWTHLTASPHSLAD